MTESKRAFDIIVAVFLMAVLSPVFLGLAITIAVRDGRPVFYLSERMRTPNQAFRLIKFRTMTVVDEDSGVSGRDKASRITALGAWMRARRLDELPQLWNVLRGDISFVGPRPPLRQYVERFPDLYAEVLRARPGITGLATLVFHRHEEWLLSSCQTRVETDAVYARRCVPRKAKLDLIYLKNRSFCWDLRMMFATVFRSVSVRRKPAQVGSSNREISPK